MIAVKRTVKGFTLVELLIVVVILGVLASALIPQFGSSTEDAKLSSLKSTLSEMRNTVELYYHQHNQRYPGQYSHSNGTSQLSNAGTASQAFIAQLTQYTNADGKVNGIKTSEYKYGPYIKASKLPANPFMTGDSATELLVDTSTNNITTALRADGNKGWKFYTKTGKFIANDNLTLSDGTKTIEQ